MRLLARRPAKLYPGTAIPPLHRAPFPDLINPAFHVGELVEVGFVLFVTNYPAQGALHRDCARIFVLGRCDVKSFL